MGTTPGVPATGTVGEGSEFICQFPPFGER